jgi:hypothetical protein
MSYLDDREDNDLEPEFSLVLAGLATEFSFSLLCIHEHVLGGKTQNVWCQKKQTISVHKKSVAKGFR